MYKKKPFFIVFEGVEGCGKSYQSKKLFNKLKKNKIDAILTREPGGTKSSELIRNLILKDYFSKNSKEKFDKYTDTLLYLAARNEHVINKIKPALQKKKIVICDRFIDSTLAYQCAGNNELKDFYSQISKPLINNFEPDLTILLDISPIKALERINERKNKNRYDNKNLSFFSNVRKNYNELAKNNSRIQKLNALNDKNILAEKIRKLISNLLN